MTVQFGHNEMAILFWPKWTVHFVQNEQSISATIPEAKSPSLLVETIIQANVITSLFFTQIILIVLTVALFLYSELSILFFQSNFLSARGQLFSP